MGTENLPSWWDTPKRQTIEDFKASCYDLSISIMSCFAVKLGMGNSHFTDVHQHKDPGNVLKFIKYPRFEQQPEGVPRLSEHTDWGSITFVFTEQPGLEIRDPSNEWFEIPAVPGGVVVNIGDALSLWSKKSLKSTMHRISWKNLDVSQDRFSVVYFTHPNNGIGNLVFGLEFHSDIGVDAILSSLTGDSSTKVTSVLTYKEYLKIRSALTYGSIRKVGEDG